MKEQRCTCKAERWEWHKDDCPRAITENKRLMAQDDAPVSSKTIAAEVREAYADEFRMLGGTGHYEECWRDHIPCVLSKLVDKIERLESELADVRAAYIPSNQGGEPIEISVDGRRHLVWPVEDVPVETPAPASSQCMHFKDDLLTDEGRRRSEIEQFDCGFCEFDRLRAKLAKWEAACTGKHGSQMPCNTVETPARASKTIADRVREYGDHKSTCSHWRPWQPASACTCGWDHLLAELTAPATPAPESNPSAFWYCNCRHPNTKVYYADEIERLTAQLAQYIQANAELAKLIPAPETPAPSNRLALVIQAVLKRFDHTPACACRDCTLMSELDAAFAEAKRPVETFAVQHAVDVKKLNEDLCETEGHVFPKTPVKECIRCHAQFAAIDRAAEKTSDGYMTAFYQIADLLGLPAMPISPKEAFETVMLPRLRELLASDTNARLGPGIEAYCRQCASRDIGYQDHRAAPSGFDNDPFDGNWHWSKEDQAMVRYKEQTGPVSVTVSTAAETTECSTCNDTGEIDETLGGIARSNPHAPCPDCRPVKTPERLCACDESAEDCRTRIQDDLGVCCSECIHGYAPKTSEHLGDETSAATSRGARSTEDAGRPQPPPKATEEQK